MLFGISLFWLAVSFIGSVCTYMSSNCRYIRGRGIPSCQVILIQTNWNLVDITRVEQCVEVTKWDQLPKKALFIYVCKTLSILIAFSISCDSWLIVSYSIYAYVFLLLLKSEMTSRISYCSKWLDSLALPGDPPPICVFIKAPMDQ